MSAKRAQPRNCTMERERIGRVRLRIFAGGVDQVRFEIVHLRLPSYAPIDYGADKIRSGIEDLRRADTCTRMSAETLSTLQGAIYPPLAAQQEKSACRDHRCGIPLRPADNRS